MSQESERHARRLVILLPLPKEERDTLQKEIAQALDDSWKQGFEECKSGVVQGLLEGLFKVVQ